MINNIFFRFIITNKRRLMKISENKENGVKLSPKDRKRAEIIVKQWFEFEAEVEKLNKAILEKFQRIKNVIPINKLTELNDLIPHEQSERIEETG